MARVYRKKTEDKKPEFIGEESLQVDDVKKEGKPVKKSMVAAIDQESGENEKKISRSLIGDNVKDNSEQMNKEKEKGQKKKMMKVVSIKNENEKKTFEPEVKKDEEAEPEKTIEPKVVRDSPSLSYIKKTVPEKLSDNGVSNILVDYKDELPDVIEQIEEVKTKKIVVSIPEGSDLLVSSVGMRLISRHAEKQGKLVVIVTDDPAGRNMARLAGLGVADSTANVDDQLWFDAQAMMSAKKESDLARAERREMKDEISPEMVADDTRKDIGVLINKDFHDNLEATSDILEGVSARAGVEAPEKKVIGKVEAPEKVESAVIPEEKIMVEKPRIRKVAVGDFELTIDDGRKEMVTVRAPSSVESKQGEAGRGAFTGFVGRDFSGLESGRGVPSQSYDTLPVTLRGEGRVRKGSFLMRLGAVFAGLLAVIPKGASAAAGGIGKGILKRFVFPLILVVLAVVGIGYWYLPEVFVEIDVESIAVDFSGDVTALKNIEKIKYEELQIPARAETIEKTGSDSAAATGTAVRGEKAEGTVLIFNKTGDDLAIAGGTRLSNGGLNFILQETVTIAKCEETPCEGSNPAYHFGTGSVLAEEVGTEYNVASGTIFAVAGYDSALVFGKAQSAFTRGSSTTYQVVSQSDIDAVAEKLKTDLYGQAKTALQEKLNGTKWVFVEASIKNELDGDVSSDVPAGAEKASVNVNVKTKSTALYYDGKAFSSLIENLLLKNLKEEESKTLELSEDREESVVVKSASVDEGNIVLTIIVSGYVMPHLDEKEIERDLYGKPWAEGIADLKKLDYVSGNPKVEFYPEWFPSFMRRMPSRRGQITVNINNVVPKEDKSPAEEGTGKEM